MLLLLPACSDRLSPYDYGLSWTCQSAEGCERAAELMLIDRMGVQNGFFYFVSSRDAEFYSTAQRVHSDSLPAGCFWLYSLRLDGSELEPSKVCSAPGGFDLELSIPKRNPATYSQWLVEARELGW
ncbi:MAG TPA: hypothetical protein VNM90_20720 [Haliangium sp.]|nr:hypothetical protein [Haliangium sp.]